MSDRRILSVIAIAALAAVNTFAGAPKSSLKSIGDGLICQCGCVQTVNACNHVECPALPEMTAMAQKEIKEGKEETTILQDFVLRYGVQVLASPPARGFNLTVWILPALALVTGLAAVIAIVRRWRKPSAEARQGGPAVEPDPKILAAIEEEMKRSGLGT